MGDKITWSQEQLKCLLETCIEEVNKVGRKGLSMHKDSWTKLGSVLKERFGMELSQKQMKNCYDNLKAKYVGWAYLKSKTGNLYNPQTNMFNLTTEEWDDFKKVCMKKKYYSLYYLYLKTYVSYITYINFGLGSPEGCCIENTSITSSRTLCNSIRWK